MGGSLYGEGQPGELVHSGFSAGPVRRHGHTGHGLHWGLPWALGRQPGPGSRPLCVQVLLQSPADVVTWTKQTRLAWARR